jgi:hypothetical protein
MNVQLPSTMVAKEFGEVNVRRAGPDLEVSFTILMEPQGAEAEGWQTGVALDASSSMKSAYGRSLKGDLPPDVAADYLRRGWMTRQQSDGRAVQRFADEGRRDAIARGYLTPTPNTVEPLARDFISYLAGNLDADGGTTVIYWAAGDGSAFEVVGDFTADQCRSLKLEGPKGHRFGTGTRLTPAVRYFEERFADAARGMYLFLTDGRLDDLDAVKRYTTDLCRRIAAGKRNPVKCVLIGVGGHIDERQMEELDDLDTGTGVDVWDHKIAADMRGVVEIFAEVVSENQIVADTARIFDPSGRVVKNFADGLPAAVSFRVPGSAAWFELEVGGERIRQPLVVPPPPLPRRR